MARMASPAHHGSTRRTLLRGAAGMWLAALATEAVAQTGYEVRPWLGATPPLRLDDLDGRSWDLQSFAGRALLLNFWASWCEPCRAEMPSLERIARRHEADGLTVLAINFKESGGTIRRFLERTPIGLPVLRDGDGAAARAWQVRIFPSTVLVDRSGRARGVVLGEMDWEGEAAAGLLRPLLEAKTRA
jgi:thiol-disulfide isomerase/thioredoxin